ncbi:ABC transporter ATP-binding protein [Butyricicoccus sp.]|uniref:ABC transporter ATP-binding protein n=1 Tax=Butyricicoccus sp. TaxID=2049021 RepID=UPI003D7DB053
MEKQYYVQMKGVNKSFGNFQASKNINFGIEKGKLVGLLGPSGSGKTTILRMLAGLETADSGDILIDGKVVNDVPASKRGIGFVFQSYALFRYMTIYDNVAFGLKIQKWPKQRIKERVQEMLKLVGLEGLENRYPNQLSGGQRQRIAFARALAPQPQLLLLDEPFAAIDAKVRLELRSWLREMISSVGVTSIFVTHDQDEAIEVADQIIITNQGQIEQIGSPKDIYRTPHTPFVAQFIGQSSVVENFQKFSGFENADVRAKHAAVRPEYITVTKQGEYLKYPIGSEEGVVESTAFRGSEIELKIRVKDSVLTAKRLLDEAPIEVGENVKVFIYRVYAFDDEKAYVIENAALTSPDSVFI